MTSSSSSQAAPYLDIQWVPNLPDCLLTWSTDIRLYRVVEKYDAKATSNHGFWLSETHFAEFETAMSNPPHYIKCLALHPDGAMNGLANLQLAVGQANGRISLLSFHRCNQKIKEFSPRALRQCHDLAWNSFNPKFLAAGFEKARNDAGILIFDTEKNAVMSTVTTGASSRFSLGQSREEKSSYVKAVFEMAVGDTCHSLTWLNQHIESLQKIDSTIDAKIAPNSKQETEGIGEKVVRTYEMDKLDSQSSIMSSVAGPHNIIAGINSKNIKVFDIRIQQPQKVVSSTYTRAVHGICVDPFLEYRVASHFENQVLIWDTRHFEKPIITQVQKQKVIKIGWSPSRAGLLCSAEENSSKLSVHDIQSWAYLGEDGEPSVTDRSIGGWCDKEDHGTREDTKTRQKPDRIGAFAWHPDNPSRIVALSNEEKLIGFLVNERLAPNWSSQHCLVWQQRQKLRLFHTTSTSFPSISDISVVMQERAKKGYGLCDNLSENGKLVSGDSPESKSLRDVWIWLQDVSELSLDSTLMSRFPNFEKFCGIRNALGLNSQFTIGGSSTSWLTRSEMVSCGWIINSNMNIGSVDIYKSDKRYLCQRICGWSRWDKSLYSYVEKCEKKHQFSRAACIAAFCLNIRFALEVLERGSRVLADINPKLSESLNLTSISLSGFNLDTRGLWREKVKASLCNIKDPYLRAMFTFLTNSPEDKSYKAVLENLGLEVPDKIAFACHFLSDEALTDVVNKSWDELLAIGSIKGVLFCGMASDEALQLLQQYIDVSGDVQTVSAMVVQAMPSSLAVQRAPQSWLSGYRQLLDCWKLWIERAEFDLQVKTSGFAKSVPPQVFISCNFCGSNISNQAKPGIRELSKQMGPNSRKNIRLQACPTCRKPLPRCAICLLTMGSQSGININGTKTMSAFDQFFTWCQSCRHGGHAGHLTDWFASNSECPVAGCPCTCATLDPESITGQASHILDETRRNEYNLSQFMESTSLSQNAF